MPVVALDYLNVVIRSQHGSYISHYLPEQVHANAHVRGHDKPCLLTKLPHVLPLSL